MDPDATIEISTLALIQIVKYTDTFIRICKSGHECTLESVIVQISGLLKILHSLSESKLIAEQVAEKPFVAEAIGQLMRHAEGNACTLLLDGRRHHLSIFFGYSNR